MRRWTVLVLLAVAFVVGELNPLDWIYWKAAEWKLPRMKEDSLAAASPFESIPPARWLAQSEHAFIIEERQDGCRLRHEETFRGLLIPAFSAMLDDTEKGFIALNAALKQRVESRRG